MPAATHRSGLSLVARYIKLPTMVQYLERVILSSLTLFTVMNTSPPKRMCPGFASCITCCINRLEIRSSRMMETKESFSQYISMPRKRVGSLKSCNMKSFSKFFMALFILRWCLANNKKSFTYHTTIIPLFVNKQGALSNSHKPVFWKLYFTSSC